MFLIVLDLSALVSGISFMKWNKIKEIIKIVDRVGFYSTFIIFIYYFIKQKKCN